MFRAVLISTTLHFSVLYASVLSLPSWTTVDRDFFEVVPVDLVALSLEEMEEEELTEPEEEPENDEDSVTESEDVFSDLPPEEEIFPDLASLPTPRIKPRHIGMGITEEEETEEAEETEVAENEEEDDLLAGILDDAGSIFEKPKPVKKVAQVRTPQTAIVDFESPTIKKAIMTSQIEAALLSRLKNCWPDVQDLPEPERLVVTVKMQLNQDGTIRGDARLVRPKRAAIGDRPMKQAIERALRAARRCAPYELPEGAQSFYDEWKNVTLVVGPANRKTRR